MFWIGILIGFIAGGVIVGWLCAGKVDKALADCNALEGDLKTERKRVAAYMGECRKLDAKLYQMTNKPSMGE
jgi:uncharacterized membrane-anchored protein YhcB (DUF1043 family)